MSRQHHQPTTSGARSAPHRALFALAASALVLALLSGAALAAGSGSGGGGGEVARLRTGLDRMSRLANRRLRPAAQRLANDLPAARDRLSRLREPASTAQAQIEVSLDQLREMTSVATLDPHYMPALVAAARAYIAASGLDPVTGTEINPGYRGLDRELASGAAGLDRSAAEAGGLAAAVKSLREELSRSRRHARRVERQLRRMRARAVGQRRG
jgi:hypothetical protein